MSLEDARAYLHRVKRGVRAAAVDPRGRGSWYDCETVLSVVAAYGARAGYQFSDEEYRLAATEEVKALLASRGLVDEGDYIVLSHDLVAGGGDYLVFMRGVREEGNRIIYDAGSAHLAGGSVR